jgi:acyl-lipid omega-6 desaturase (Delta-12 desaturase)
MIKSPNDENFAPSLLALVDNKFGPKGDCLLPLVICFSTMLFYLLTLIGIFYFENIFIKLTLSMFNGLAIGQCFLVGHDLCHQAFFKSRIVNGALGRIFFAPSLTPFSSWELEHNIIHHGYTNLVGRDIIWNPLSRLEYENLSGFGKMLYRLERSVFGPIYHWIFKFWIPKMVWKPLFSLKKLTVKIDLVVALLPVSILLAICLYYPRYLELIGFSIILPHLVWAYLVGFVTYLHHTHKEVKWFSSVDEWRHESSPVYTTVRINMPKFIDFIFFRIMHHNAHHLLPRIPMYRLKAAQLYLQQWCSEKENERIKVSTLGSYFTSLSCCKLYDFENKKWSAF